MNGKGAAAILLLHPASDKGGGMGYGGSKKEDAAASGGDEEADAPDADYNKILLSSAKDILDAEDPKALKTALYEFVSACIKKEQAEGEG